MHIKQSIQLINVSVFSAPNLPPALKNCSLTILLGQFITISGKSRGKSLLLKLINGLVQPDLGVVLIDHHHLSQLNLSSLHRQMCYIHQKMS